MAGMDFLEVAFSVSGVKTNVLVPPLVALAVSFFTSMGGVSGAFLLLPFQMSALGYTSPSVSATNFVYNIVAIPSGVYRFAKEGRMAWPMAWVVIAGTLPGVFIGYFLRVRYLSDPKPFKLFVGCVLLYMGVRLFYEVFGFSKSGNKAIDAKFKEKTAKHKGKGLAQGVPDEAVVRTVHFSLARVEYEFWGERFSFSTPAMFFLAFVVGILGGTYGIGGGAIIAPFCVAVFHLPVYTVAGAAMLGTFLTSVAGVVFYSVVPSPSGVSVSPDWPLGLLFGAGGFVGIYIGARLQKFMPQKIIKSIVGIVILYVSTRYIYQFF